MERKQQLSNVAFGGSWVDAIGDREWLAEALSLLAAAERGCMEEDMRSPALREALDTLAGRIARGPMLAEAYWRALGLVPTRRRAEVARVGSIIRSAVGLGEVE